MGVHSENEKRIRQEIADIITDLRPFSDLLKQKDPVPEKEMERLMHDVTMLKRKASVLHYLNANREPEMPPAPQETVKPAAEIVLPPAPVAEVKVREPENPVPPVAEKKEQPKTEKKFPDLKTFIGFNEKIMFLKNLFRNDSAAYEEAIKQLNACASFGEAESFLSVVKNEYGWKNDSEAVQHFTDTVRRRFS
ncbi:MAG TPA: hypothetical protein VFU15_16890 [Bacteroidia bacterium]|nr:hypothetical protein [Bacteroidia bacterium]